MMQGWPSPSKKTCRLTACTCLSLCRQSCVPSLPAAQTHGAWCARLAAGLSPQSPPPKEPGAEGGSLSGVAPGGCAWPHIAVHCWLSAWQVCSGCAVGHNAICHMWHSYGAAIQRERKVRRSRRDVWRGIWLSWVSSMSAWTNQPRPFSPLKKERAQQRCVGASTCQMSSPACIKPTRTLHFTGLASHMM